MDFITNLGVGFAVVFKFVPMDIWPGAGSLVVSLPMNILLCLIGALIGTLIGVLPGIGPIATIAMLLPITYKLDPTGALIMLAGIYYGAQYGGSTTAILVNLPGKPPRSSPRSMVTRWPRRAGPVRRSPLPP